MLPLSSYRLSDKPGDRENTIREVTRNRASGHWRDRVRGWCSVRTGESFPVFKAPGAGRRRYLWGLSWSLAFPVASLAEVFILSVIVNPALPRLNLRQISSPPVKTDLRPRAPRLGANREGQK